MYVCDSGLSDGETQELKFVSFSLKYSCRKLLFQELECVTGPTLTPGNPQAIQPLCSRVFATG